MAVVMPHVCSGLPPPHSVYNTHPPTHQSPLIIQQASRDVSALQELMVPANYKLKVPEEYSKLPQLQVCTECMHGWRDGWADGCMDAWREGMYELTGGWRSKERINCFVRPPLCSAPPSDGNTRARSQTHVNRAAPRWR